MLIHLQSLTRLSAGPLQSLMPTRSTCDRSLALPRAMLHEHFILVQDGMEGASQTPCRYRTALETQADQMTCKQACHTWSCATRRKRQHGSVTISRQRRDWDEVSHQRHARRRGARGKGRLFCSARGCIGMNKRCLRAAGGTYARRLGRLSVDSSMLLLCGTPVHTHVCSALFNVVIALHPVYYICY